MKKKRLTQSTKNAKNAKRGFFFALFASLAFFA